MPLNNVGVGSGGVGRANVAQTLNLLASSAAGSTAAANILAHLASALEQQTKVMEFESKKQALERLVDLFTLEGNMDQADNARGKLKDLLVVHMN